MTELEVLIAIHRAIDRAVTADATGRARAAAARYLPLYADPAAVGWTRSLEVVLGPPPDGGRVAVDDEPAAPGPPPEALLPVAPGRPGRGRRPGDGGRSLQVDPVLAPLSPDDPVRPALRELAEREPRGRMLSRLLVALAVLGRVAPPVVAGEDGLELDADFTGAMGPFLPEGSDVPEVELALQLLDDDQFPDLRSWPEFAAEAAGSFALRSDVVDQPPPCLDSIVVEEVDGRKVAVARMATMTGSKDVTDAQVEWFLDPGSWPRCSPLYCEMLHQGSEPVDPAAAQAGVEAIDRWLEVLSPTCPDVATDPMEVGLVFTRTRRGERDWLLEYELDPALGNGKVVVDHGTIEVAKQGDYWWFSTTKYLRFAGVVDGSHLGLIACVLGYGTQAEDFLHNLGTAGPAPDPPGPDPDPDPG